MNNVKRIIKENIPAVVIAVVLILIIVIYSVMDYVGGKKIYQSGLLSPETVPYKNKKYDENQYKVVNVSEESIAMYYLSEIIYEIHNDPEKLWDRISSVEKEKKYNNDYKTFKESLELIITSTSSRNVLKEYGIRKNDLGKSVYVLVDNDYNSFQVTEKGVWDLEVKMLGKRRPKE